MELKLFVVHVENRNGGGQTFLVKAENENQAKQIIENNGVMDRKHYIAWVDEVIFGPEGFAAIN